MNRCTNCALFSQFWVPRAFVTVRSCKLYKMCVMKRTRMPLLNFYYSSTLIFFTVRSVHNILVLLLLSYTNSSERSG